MISEFVKGLLDIPSSEGIEKAPIQLHQRARHVRMFINLVLSSYTAKTGWHLDNCVPLLHICDQLSITALDAIVWLAIGRQMTATKKFNHVSPWDIFKMAATRGDDEMCSKAVLVFAVLGYIFDDICSQPAYFYEGIRPSTSPLS